jgi:nucleotide-binding universal stress UspA family protein
MKILLAVDHSKYSEAALHMLIKQVRAEGTEVAVLHVMEVSLADFESRATFETMRANRMRQANGLVERFAEELQQAGFATKTMVEEGDAKESIISFVERWKPDLIFVGSHGRRRFRRLALGGVAETIARHANCSVQIVRSQEG